MPMPEPFQTRPWRSVLYLPASNQRALDKAPSLAADALIFDLEDAVTPAEKPAARARLAGVLGQTDFGPRARLVRINALDTDWGRQDAAAFADLPLEGVLLPKVNSAADIHTLAALIPLAPLWAMLETPTGVLNAAAIAAHPRLAGFVLGTNDLANDLGCRTRPDRLPLQSALQYALLAARAKGLICIDGVFNALHDPDGLRAECEQGRDLGFDGKTLIHPAQIDAANLAFAPDVAEIDLARRQIAAHAEAEASGRGVAVVDGKIVENLHIVTAKRILAKADRFAEQRG